VTRLSVAKKIETLFWDMLRLKKVPSASLGYGFETLSYTILFVWMYFGSLKQVDMSQRFFYLCELRRPIVRFEAFLLTGFDGGTTVMDLRFTIFYCNKILTEILSVLYILLRRESLADL
jgi:hypothetical protein